MHRTLLLSFVIALPLVAASLGCSKSKERENPEIGNLEIQLAKTPPPSVTFTFAVDPSTAGVSPGKSECWVGRGTGVGQAGARMFKGASWKSPNGTYGGVDLSPTTQAKVWTFQAGLNDRNFPNNYIVTSITLFDDQGKASNELRVWIDYANGRLLEADGHTKLLAGKWVDEDVWRKVKVTFNKNGTYLLQGKIQTEKKEESIDEKGIWTVANGILETKPEKPAPNLAIIRRTLVFEVSDMTFRTWDRETPADPRVWKRVKAEY